MPDNVPSISVIVPVYNVKNYLNACVDSLLCQRFDDFELILVDDESTDGSGRLCDAYARRDGRVRVIHKENRGVSAARNAGIDAAKGRYLAFADGDDVAEPDMLGLLYRLLTENDADFSCCSILNCYANREFPQCDGNETLVVGNEDAYRLLLEGKKITGSPCAKLFRRELFDRVRFTVGKIYEDAIFFADIFPVVQKVAISTKPEYRYIHREGSYTTSFRENEFDAIEAYEKNLNVIREHFPALLEQGYFRYYWAYFVVLDKMLPTENYRRLPGYGRIVSFLKKHTASILRNRCFQRSRRVAAVFLWINVRLYRLLVLQNNKKNYRLYR